MKTEKKEVYVRPKLDVHVIELEQGIAAGSGNVSPDLSADDWGNGSGDTQNGDF